MRRKTAPEGVAGRGLHWMAGVAAYAGFVLLLLGSLWFFGLDGYRTWFDFLDEIEERKKHKD